MRVAGGITDGPETDSSSPCHAEIVANDRRLPASPPGPFSFAADIWHHRPMRRVYNSIFLAVARRDGFAAWVYVAATALAQPQTLPLQLTHFARWPRTDTFGELSFVLSFVAFVAYRLTREQSPQR